MKLSVPPQGHRSIIEGPIRAAVPQLIGKPLGGPMNPQTIDCPSCKQSISAIEFVTACSHYWRALDVVQFKCPRCQKDTEARIEAGKIWLGYTYVAGSPHFCGMVEVEVDELETRSDGADLTVRIGEEEWTLAGSK